MRDIRGYEGLYAITSCGKVWSYKRQKFLKQGKKADGYYRVCLCKNGEKKYYYIHRLVAEAYLPNPDNKPQVNHKDENKEHNWVSNLEWMTAKENNNYGTRTIRAATSKRVRVYCEELNLTFSSIKEAAQQTGINPGNICSCCCGRRNIAGGYHWHYLP